MLLWYDSHYRILSLRRLIVLHFQLQHRETHKFLLTILHGYFPGSNLLKSQLQIHTQTHGSSFRHGRKTLIPGIRKSPIHKSRTDTQPIVAEIYECVVEIIACAGVISGGNQDQVSKAVQRLSSRSVHPPLQDKPYIRRYFDLYASKPYSRTISRSLRWWLLARISI